MTAPVDQAAVERVRLRVDHDLAPDVFAGCARQTGAPRVVLIAEVPGGNDAAAAKVITDDLSRSRGRAAQVDDGLLRAFCPETSQQPELLRVARDRVDQWITHNRFDAVIRMPAHHPEEFLARARRFREAGFYVEVRLPAMREADRILNDIERCVQAAERAMEGHLWSNVVAERVHAALRANLPAPVAVADHARFTAGLQQIAATIDREMTAHGVHVVPADPLHDRQHSDFNATLHAGQVIPVPYGWLGGRPSAWRTLLHALLRGMAAPEVISFTDRVRRLWGRVAAINDPRWQATMRDALSQAVDKQQEAMHPPEPFTTGSPPVVAAEPYQQGPSRLPEQQATADLGY